MASARTTAARAGGQVLFGAGQADQGVEVFGLRREHACEELPRVLGIACHGSRGKLIAGLVRLEAALLERGDGACREGQSARGQRPPSAVGAHLALQRVGSRAEGFLDGLCRGHTGVDHRQHVRYALVVCGKPARVT